MHPQNKTLLFAKDINGYWCKEHQIGMARIQAVISHYRHNHNDAKITDIIEFEEVDIDKPGKSLPIKLQKQKRNDDLTESVMNTLRSKSIPLTPDRKKLIDEIRMLDNKEEKWWVTDYDKISKELDKKMIGHAFYKKAKAAGLPKHDLDQIRYLYDLPSDDADDKKINVNNIKKQLELYRLIKAIVQ